MNLNETGDPAIRSVDDRGLIFRYGVSVAVWLRFTAVISLRVATMVGAVGLC